MKVAVIRFDRMLAILQIFYLQKDICSRNDEKIYPSSWDNIEYLNLQDRGLILETGDVCRYW